MNNQTLSRVMRRHLLLVAAAVQLGVLAGLAVSLLSTPLFAASSQMFLTTPGWNATGAKEGVEVTPYTGNQFTQGRAVSYVRLASDPGLAARAAARAGGGIDPTVLSGRISAHIVPDTVLIEVTVEDPSAARSAQLADAVTAELAALIRRLETPGASLVPTVDPVVIRPADIPTSTSEPQTFDNLGLGAAFGLLAGATAAFALDRRAAARPAEQTAPTETESIVAQEIS